MTKEHFIGDVATKLGVSRATIRSWKKRGKCEYVIRGGAGWMTDAEFKRLKGKVKHG